MPMPMPVSPPGLARGRSRTPPSPGSSSMPSPMQALALKADVGEPVRSVTVHTRVRPLVERESKAEAKEQADGNGKAPQPVSWRISRAAILVDDGLRKRPWAFDRVFGPKEENSLIYEEVARPIVRRALKGYNGTVFCYGQTGSGKTYSMVGSMGGGAAAAVEHEHELELERERERNHGTGAGSKHHTQHLHGSRSHEGGGHDS